MTQSPHLAEAVLEALVKLAADRLGVGSRTLAASLDIAVDARSRAHLASHDQIGDADVGYVLAAAWSDAIMRVRPDLSSERASRLADDLIGRDHPAMVERARRLMN